MKHRTRFLLLIALIVVANGIAFPFSGENPLGEGEKIHDEALRKNWHHQDIAYDALKAAGFQVGTFDASNQPIPGAVESITWTADYIDSYLYNPLFWIPGGIGRFKVALSSQPELDKLHFDDSFSLPAVQAAYRKYVAGTLAGLMWARERWEQTPTTDPAGRANYIAAAHNILGISLHAMADFYAHSNWIDVSGRRTRTWFDYSAAERSSMALFTGAYVEPDHLGVKPHGKILPVCTLIKGGLVEQVLNAGCSGLSPFTKSTICDHHRACKSGVNINPPAAVAGIQLPQGLLFGQPGIAFDSTWLMNIAYNQRGLKDSSPQQMFETAKTLAKKASTQWLRILDGEMTRLGGASFWATVKSQSTWNLRHRSFENFSQLPYQFLSAGPWPLNPGRSARSLEKSKVQPFSVGQSRGLETVDRPVEGIRAVRLQNAEGSGALEVGDQPLRAKLFPVRPPMPVKVEPAPIIMTSGLLFIPAVLPAPVKEEYYLRVKLRTSTDTFSGTDADIILHAGGKQFLLDYMPREHPLIAYNDFEAGDEQVYTVGPFDGIPSSICIENRSASAKEVLDAFGKAFVDAVKTVIEQIGDFLLTLVGGHADHVQDGGIVWEPADLAAVGTTWKPFSKYLDGGDEGKYTIYGQIRRTNQSSIGHTAQDWAEYQVRLDTIYCNDESKIDQFPGLYNDEPFVLAILVPHPGTVRTTPVIGPLGDVDRQESHPLYLRTINSGRIPKAFGRLSVQFQIWESDSEPASKRTELLNSFAGRAETATNSSERGVLDAVGAALAADWKLQHMEVYAFGRGNRVHAGTVFNRTVNQWIEGKRTATFNMDTSACRDLGVSTDQLQTAPPGSAARTAPGIDRETRHGHARSRPAGKANNQLGLKSIPPPGAAWILMGAVALFAASVIAGRLR